MILPQTPQQDDDTGHGQEAAIGQRRPAPDAAGKQPHGRRAPRRIVDLTETLHELRAIDEAAFNRLKGSKTVVELNDAEKAAWNTTFEKVRNALKAEGKIRGDAFDDVVNAAK